MITELTNLDALVGQYDAGKLLVGPLLSLSVNSNFRYFYVAGQGSKVYEALGLGFVEIESVGQKQRADLVEKFKGRFGEVKTFDNHLEMARATQALWPNEETEKVLAAAALEAKVQSADNGSSDGSEQFVDEVSLESAFHDNDIDPSLTNTSGSDLGVLSADDGNQLVDDGAEGVTPYAEDVDSDLTNATTFARDQRQLTPLLQPEPTLPPLRLPDVGSNWPLGGRAVTYQQPSGFDQDDIALAVLGLRSAMGLPPELPVKRTRGLTSRILEFCALAGVAALAAWVVVLLSPRWIAERTEPAAPLIAADRNNSSSQVAASVTSSPDQTVEAKDPVLPAESVLATSPTATSPPLQGANAQAKTVPVAEPPSMPLQATGMAANAAPVSAPQSSPFSASQSSPSPPAASIQANATPVSAPPSSTLPASVEAGAPPSSGPPSPSLHPASGLQSSPPQVASVEAGHGPDSGLQSPSAQGASTSQRLRLSNDEITALINRAKDFLKDGDFASARLLLRRAAEAGSADATLMLGETFDPLVMHEHGAIGIAPNIAEARQWYEKAAKLGSEVATERLSKLVQIGH